MLLTLSSQIMKDQVLFIIIFAIVSVDMIIIIIGTALPFTRYKAVTICPENNEPVSLIGLLLHQ